MKSLRLTSQQAATELLRRRRARNGLIDYSRYTNRAYRPADHHEQIAEKLEAVERGECKRLMIFMPPRHGKQLSHDTLVPTPSGYVQHGDLRPGDFVFGLDGLPTRVVAIGSESSQDVEIEFTNGEAIRCHEAHEWVVLDRRSYPAAKRVLEARQLEADFWIGPKGRGGRARWQMPDVGALEYGMEVVLPIHPYALGVWLGDGSTTKPHITGIDEEVFQGVAACGYAESARWVHSTTGVTTCSYGSGVPNVRSEFSAELKAIGVIGRKHIPEIYLRASVEQRKQLLAGIVDTDGHVEMHTGRHRVVTGDEGLASDIADLAQSLGYRPYVVEAEPTVSSSGIEGRRVVYTVAFQPTEPLPTRIPRKQCRKIAARRRIAIREVRRVPQHMGRCIQVAASDGIYLVGRKFVPTHNSELASRRFPAWFMGRNGAMSTIAASYNSDLAGDFGRDVRNIVAGPEHKALFPDSGLAADSKAQNRWHTTQGGGYAAAGVGTAVTGRGAHVFLIDDPVKDRESADSELLREKTYRWYLSTAYTRLEGTLVEQDRDPLWRDLDEAQELGEPFEGAVVLIQTRWHEDDLAGKLLADMDRGADQWEVLSLPAIKDGKALWPAKYTLERLNRIKTQLSTREWESLYQQSPTPDQGTYFQREWFPRHDTAPDNLNKFIFSDFAVTEDGGDFTELGVIGLDTESKAYDLDWWSGQTTANEWIEKAIDLMEEHKPRAFFGESGVIRRAIEPILRKRMRERKVFCRLEWLTRGSDKTAMARAIQARAENGMVSISRSKSGEACLEQMVAFPAGKHDDKVDVWALLGMALSSTHPALNDTSQADRKPKRRRYLDQEEGDDNWRTV